MAARRKSGAERPEIFRYHDYQAFLKDWLAYRKASQSGFSARHLAKEAGLAAGYLPMVLGGKRPLTGKALSKLEPFLGLNAQEQSYLRSLLVLGTSDSQEARLGALDRMKRFHKYVKANRNEAEVYEYLTHWYYVAIREMAALEGFRLEPEWIQSQLRVQVPLKEIKDAIEFLTSNGYLEVAKDGKVRPPDKNLECIGGVYRVALTQYHRELLDLAAQSIANTPSDQRSIVGHTFAIKSENYDQAKAILDEAIRQVQRLGKDEKNGDSVYHMEVALFPMTTRRNQG